jgi:hypothetical protein
MNEYVFPGRALDEAVALSAVEPLYCALLSHNQTPFASARVLRD